MPKIFIYIKKKKKKKKKKKERKRIIPKNKEIEITCHHYDHKNTY